MALSITIRAEPSRKNPATQSAAMPAPGAAAEASGRTIQKSAVASSPR